MSVFVDTGLFFAHHDRSAAEHGSALRALREVAAGRWGKAFTSDYVFDEAFTLTRARMRSDAAAFEVADRVLGRGGHPAVFDMLMVTGPMFRSALRVLEHYRDKPLSFTDATTVALVARRRIEHVLSFDRDFDGIVSRIDPRELE